MKIKRNNRLFNLSIATFILLAGFLFFGATKDVYAKSCKCSTPSTAVPKGAPTSITIEATDEKDCATKCVDAGYISYGFDGWVSIFSAEGESGKSIKTPSMAEQTVIWALTPILQLVSWILNLAVLLFAWIIDPKTLMFIIDNDSVRDTWKIVRDICNIAFILILIFSAFATIFQVDKYNYKKILLWLIIMALLVNFSYPIARFIIDASNSLMYSVLNMEFSGYADKGGEIFTKTPAFGSLRAIVTSESTGIAELVASIVFIFILALTILALSLILIIRTLALAIIVIFSPIGFVGTIIGKDGGWWGHLFKYAMAGPIIAFVLFISINLMESVKDIELTSAGKMYSPDNMPMVANMANFAIPIIILWFGMAMAVKGIEGAGTILGKAQGFAKWVGKLPGRGAKTYLKKFDRDHIGVRGAIKAWKDRTAELETDKVGYQTARARDWMGSIFDRGKRDSKFYRDVNDSNMKAKYKKEQDLFSTTDVDVIAGINKLKGKNDRESTLRREAFFETLAGNKDLNEWSKHKLGKFDPILARDSIYEEFGGDKNEERAVDVLHNISDLNQVNGVYSMCGMTHDITEAETYDAAGNVIKGKKGDKDRIGQRRKSVSDEYQDEQLDAAVAKMKQIDYQKMMIGLHADSIVTEDKDGKGSGVHTFGLKALEFIEGKDAKFVTDRWRGDTGEKIRQGLMANPEVAKRFPLILAALTGGEEALKEAKAAAKKKNEPAAEKPKEEPKEAEPVKEEEPRIKVVGKYSPLK